MVIRAPTLEANLRIGLETKKGNNWCEGVEVVIPRLLLRWKRIVLNFLGENENTLESHQAVKLSNDYQELTLHVWKLGVKVQNNMDSTIKI